MVFLSGLCGLTMFAYYTVVGCDPLKSRKIGNPNQVFKCHVYLFL